MPTGPICKMHESPKENCKELSSLLRMDRSENLTKRMLLHALSGASDRNTFIRIRGSPILSATGRADSDVGRESKAGFVQRTPS